MALRKIKTENKSDQKDALDPSKDQFVTRTMSAFDWAYEHRRPIIALLASVLAVAVAGIVIDGFWERSNEAASSALSDGLMASVSPVIPASDGDDPAVPKAEKEEEQTFETIGARATETLKGFKQAVEKTDSGSIIQIFAKLGMAAAHYDLKEYGQAIEIYKAIASSKDASTGWIQQLALEGLGLALEAAGRFDEAKTQFEKMAGTTDGSAAPIADYHAARHAEKAGDTEKAQIHYKKVVDAFAEQGDVSQLDYLFVQARERLLSIDPTADVPPLPGGGMGALDGIDPKILKQLMQAQAGGGPS
ncbi:MAG: hypothetical protein QNJ97_17390 [Myxococcota bacterium]|nr:hypothetical protein [Myxococcota bacterium]